MKFSRFLLTGALVMSVTSTASARDALKCYKAGGTIVPTNIHLNDALQGLEGTACEANPAACPGESRNFTATKVKDYCVPASSDDNGTAPTTDPIGDLATKYVFYSTARAAGECSVTNTQACQVSAQCPMGEGCNLYSDKYNGKAAKNTSVRVKDSNVDLRVNFSKEVGVLAPANTGATAPVAGSKETYKCYAVKQAKASCVGGTNNGQACGDSSECGGGTCTANAKFPKGTHPPTGLVTAFTNDEFHSNSPDNSFQLKKLKMFCQAAEANGEEITDRQAGMLCYGAKQLTGSAFVSPAVQTASSAVSSSTGYEVKKPELFCTPACVEPNETVPTFTDYIVKANSVAIGTTENVGQALDIDGDTTRDNNLRFIAPLVNGTLADTVTDGSLMLLFHLNVFADGAATVKGYTGELASGGGAGCPGGVADVNDGTKFCEYNATGGSFVSECSFTEQISVPVTLAGTGVPPTATAIGGGPTTTFSIAFGLGDASFTLTATKVRVDATFTHDGMDISAASGVIGGAVTVLDFIDAIGQLEGECVAGMPIGGDCTSDADCGGVVDSCELLDTLAGQSPSEIAAAIPVSLLPPMLWDIDIDGGKNCVAGSNRNETCVSLTDCPDQVSGSVACQQNEGISLGLPFTAIDADIVGVNN